MSFELNASVPGVSTKLTAGKSLKLTEFQRMYIQQTCLRKVTTQLLLCGVMVIAARSTPFKDF